MLRLAIYTWLDTHEEDSQQRSSENPSTTLQALSLEFASSEAASPTQRPSQLEPVCPAKFRYAGLSGAESASYLAPQSFCKVGWPVWEDVWEFPKRRGT